MSLQTPDNRSPQRKFQDEQIASESPIPTPDLPIGAKALPLEAHLRQPRPMALAGVAAR
ncbi:MAG: hypothetical protein WD851_00575 [Pirellulales bacterium]